MKKRKIAIMLVTAMLLQSGNSIKAETIPIRYDAEAEEVSYVVVGEDKEAIEEIVGTELEENSFQVGTEELVVSELTAEEAEELEGADVIIEEDSLFTASAVPIETELEAGETETGETKIPEKNPLGLQETEKAQEIETELEEICNTEEIEKINEPERAETTELEEVSAPEETETIELEEIDETEEIESEEIIEETESTETESSPEKEKAEAEEAWNLAAVHAEAYVKDTAPKERIKIAVLDSGADYRASVHIEAHVSTLEGEESNPFFEDATGHGTAVTSLIVSSLDEESIQGINEDAAVYSVQVLDGNNTGTLSSVVKGIYWAIENDMDIINMSFGTPKSSAILEKAVKDASEAGILLVAAAGNTPNGDVEYPAAYEEVLAVGSGSMSGEIATESTRGEKVDIYAPGAGIMVNAPLFGTTIESGSSLACAQVSGAVSVVWEKDRTKDAAYIRELLKETANKGIDPEYGAGLLDVEEAISQLNTFVPGEKTEEPEEKSLLEFDAGEIAALWVKAEHQKMVPADTSGYRLMYAAAAFPDEEELKGGLKSPNNDNKNPLNVDKRFHGSKNYFATLNFLVNLAHSYYLKDWKEINRCYQAAEIEKELKCKEGWNIVKNMEWYLNNEIFPDLGVNEGTKHNMAYKVMGVAIHVVGDIYAHRTVVTSDMLRTAQKTGNSDNGYFVKKDFKDWNYFKTEVATGRGGKSNKPVEFRYLNSKYIEKQKGEKRSINRMYEDNVNIEPWRYQDSAKVVKSLVKDGAKYDFRKNTWKQSALQDLDKLSKDI